MSFRKYEEYKESGVEWLGEVPAHWEVRRLKYICRFAYGDSLPSEKRIEGDVPVYGSNGPVGFHSFSNTTAPCIIIGRKGSFGKVNYSSDAAFAIDTTFFVDSRYTNANIRWLYYLLGLLQLDAVSKDSIVPGLNREDAYQQIGLYPPLEGQKRIAAFLDKEMTNIDTLIDKQEQLITLLQEKRQAIISHVVTRGLNPNVKMKDSGIEWLGGVPEHWEVSHLRWFISLKSGEGLSDSQFSKETLDEDSYPVIGGNGTMGYSKHFNTTQKAFAIGRVGALCGNVHFLKEKCWITDNALKVSKWEGFNDSYFEYMLRAANLNQYANQSAQPLITGEQVKALPVPRLPLEEQKRIAAFLDKETAKIDTLIGKCETAIELLKERRTALISAAVTGKIDVRITT